MGVTIETLYGTMRLRDAYPEINTNFTNVNAGLDALETEIQSVASGSPSGVYATLVALQAAFPTGDTGIYVVVADGHWYYWSGAAWTSGGVYQSTESIYLTTDALRSKMITTFQLSEGWVSGAGTQTADSVNGVLGFPALKIAENNNTAGTLYSKLDNITLDLTTFNNGEASDNYDFIYIEVYCSDVTAIEVGVTTVGLAFGSNATYDNSNRVMFNLDSTLLKNGINKLSIPKQSGLIAGTGTLSAIQSMRFHWNSVLNKSGAYISCRVAKLISKEVVPFYDFSYADDVMELMNKNTLAFVYANDIHYNASKGVEHCESINRIKEMISFSQQVGVDFTVLNGDVIDGYQAIALTRRDYMDVLSELMKSDVPVFVTKGNHDDNSWWSAVVGTNVLAEVITTDEFYIRAIKPLERNGIVVNPLDISGGYYYKDFDNIKIRAIALNTVDIPYEIDGGTGELKYDGAYTFALREPQIEWLANVALDLSTKASPADWGVIIFSHHPIPESLNAVGNTVINQVQTMEIIVGLKTGASGTVTSAVTDFTCDVDYDFSGTIPTIIAMVYGHKHVDDDDVVSGIHNIVSKELMDAAGGFETFIVDRDAEKIYIKRHNNATYDREITY